MSRMVLCFALSVLLTAANAFGQSDVDDNGGPIQISDGLISFGHQTDCAGCRAFLAGHSSTRSLHGPSCSCGRADGEFGGYSAAGGNAPGGEFAEDYQDLMASDVGAGLGYESAAPGMVGDFFGSGYMVRADEFRTFQQDYFNVSIAGGDRRFKIAENNTPIPTDRVFFNYNHFHNALQTANGKDANLNRGVAGFEKTILDQWWSVEARLPFSSGLNSDQVITSFAADNVTNELGNVGLALKRLLFQDQTLAMSIGLGAVLPTADDTRIFTNPGDPNPDIVIENEAFYLQPFAGYWWTPNDRFFHQFLIQADFDAKGNTVLVQDGRLVPQGVIQDQTLLFLDAAFGYWVFRDSFSDRLVTGIAPMIELHHTTTLQDSDVVDFSNAVGGGFNDTNNVTNPSNRQDVLNFTGAIRLELAGRSYLTFAGVAPLRTNEKLFDAEFSVQYSRFW